MKYYLIEEDFKDDAYIKLIDWARDKCDRFSLAWQSSLYIQSDIEEILKAHKTIEEITSEWPGTKKFDSTAIVRHYRINDLTTDTLRSVNSVFSWRAPDYPEDLAFYTKDDKVWFGSVAHEGFSFFIEPTFDRKRFKHIFPDLKFTAEEHEAT